MSGMERLIERYERFISLPWDRNLAGAQKVWFVVYNKTDERRLGRRMENFELATRSAGHGWVHQDLTDSFPQWMAGQEYRTSYLESPEDLALLMSDFEARVVFLASHQTALPEIPGFFVDNVVFGEGVPGLAFIGFKHIHVPTAVESLRVHFFAVFLASNRHALIHYFEIRDLEDPPPLVHGFMDHHHPVRDQESVAVRAGGRKKTTSRMDASVSPPRIAHVARIMWWKNKGDRKDAYAVSSPRDKENTNRRKDARPWKDARRRGVFI